MQSGHSQIDRRQSAILHRECRRRAPDLWLAVRFLPRAARDRLLATAAVLRLLADVVYGRDVESERGLNGDEAEAEPESAGGCACGSGSMEMRAAVAHNIVEFLFEQAKPGAIGRIDMEAFVALLQSRPMPREAFEAYVDGLVALAEVRRIATPRGLARLVFAAAGPVAEIVLAVAVDRSAGSGVAAAAREGAAFVLLSRALLTLRESCEDDDQCLVPLADLSARGLRDSDLFDWLGDGAADAAMAQRCEQVAEDFRARCLSPLGRAAGLMELLAPAPARAAAAYLGLWAHAAAFEPLGKAQADGPLSERLRAHRFRTWRFAIARRIDPKILAMCGEAEALHGSAVQGGDDPATSTSVEDCA